MSGLVGSGVDQPRRRRQRAALAQDQRYGQPAYMLATFADSFRNSVSTGEFRRVGQEAAANGRQAQWHGLDLTDAAPEAIEAVLADPALGTIAKLFSWNRNRSGPPAALISRR